MDDETRLVAQQLAAAHYRDERWPSLSEAEKATWYRLAEGRSHAERIAQLGPGVRSPFHGPRS